MASLAFIGALLVVAARPSSATVAAESAPGDVAGINQRLSSHELPVPALHAIGRRPDDGLPRNDSRDSWGVPIGALERLGDGCLHMCVRETAKYGTNRDSV